MISRIPVAITAALAVSGLAIQARAQDSGAPATAAHSRAHATQGAGSTATAGANKSQGSYSMGLVLGSQLPKLGLDAKVLDFSQVELGLKDVVSGKVQPTAADQQSVQQLVQQAKTGAAEKNPAASHSLGLLLGYKLPQLGLQEKSVDFARISQGLQDVMSGKVQATPADAQAANSLLLQSRAELGNTNAAAARRFLATNAKRPGVQTTKSGLQYKVLSSGSGTPPQPTDQVTVNYRGTLLDGKEFDSSYAHGKPYTYPVSQQMIPGWQEAVAMMKPGAKWQLFIPPELAYGPNPPPPIPPNSLLKFDIELVNVAPAPAAPAIPAPGGASSPNPAGGPGR